MDNFIKLSMVRINQFQAGAFFTGKITFGELKSIFKLSERQETNEDPFQLNLIDDHRETQEFQRHLSSEKIRKIKEYLKEHLEEIKKSPSGDISSRPTGLFPSSLILYNREWNETDLCVSEPEGGLTEKIIRDSYREDLDCCFWVAKDDLKISYDLYIPKNKGITLIVDGQHRFFGLLELCKGLYDKKDIDFINNFEFIVTYLVGFDLFQVSEIFANVNFTQKPVNRSLYYDIFGAAPKLGVEDTYRNRLKLAHDLVIHLNNNDSSPLKGKVKQLGRGNGLISQAFFVDNLLKYPFKIPAWKEYIQSYAEDKDDYMAMATFMRSYFTALKEAYPSSWPVAGDTSRTYTSILCKTTGLGAYLRLINDIFPLVQNDLHTPSTAQTLIRIIFSKLPDEAAAKLFGKGGPYSGAGSGGLQDKLYKELKSIYKLNK